MNPPNRCVPTRTPTIKEFMFNPFKIIDYMNARIQEQCCLAEIVKQQRIRTIINQGETK